MAGENIETVKAELAATKEALAKRSDELGVITKRLEVLEKQPDYRAAGGNPSEAFHIRKGEDPMSSRPFMFMKLFGFLKGELPEEECKMELEIARDLNEHYGKKMGSAGYAYQAPSNHRGSHLAPLASSFMHDSIVPREISYKMKCMVRDGVQGADPDHAAWIHQKAFGVPYDKKALSWLNETLGGSLVAPPDQGEIIQLLRNREALVNAGARTVPLPPQGRIVYPRQTSASNTFWIGENRPITSSDINTGEVTLQAKKLAVLIEAPNELLRFASPAAEAMIRDDMTRSLALGLDLACLEGAGGDKKPLGIINRPGITTITSSRPGAGTAGDEIVPEDIYLFPSAVEENNADMTSFIMRPKTLYEYYRIRSDAVAQGDRRGVFVYNLIREAGMGTQALLGGYPVTKTTQVSRSRTKNTATAGGGPTNLTYIIAGMWPDYLIGMFGGIEFAATGVGDTTFRNDQTWIRGILTADAAPRHEAAFVLMDNLIVPNL